ncbi:MAG: TSUP family transporter, partial [Euryarchaeota archaeon]|nr:TSUP family transporter [Euryarchaeota archaeon]
QIGTALAGTASGILGIGGGAILVTLNKSLLKMDAHKAAGTSYQIGSTIVPVALLSHIILDGIFYDLLDSVGLVLVILIPLLAFIFAFSGAKYAIQYLPDKVVTIVFLIAVSLSLIRYFIDFATMI